MKNLNLFHNFHQNETIVVCGCGESLNDLERPERFITIGVNDVGRKFQPNHLVVVNPRNQFSGDRFGYVETSEAEYLFTQLDLGVKHPNIVRFQLGTFGGTDFSDLTVLHYTNNSPYIAVCLAIRMGAKRIGLIGVDFTDHHFYAKTGRHPLAPQFEAINKQYQRLAKAAELLGIEIYNLSTISRLTAFPKMRLDEFENLPRALPEITEKTESLKIVSYATTPVAGVPAILARCINERTTHSARCVWATNDYGNGVKFAGDVEWRNQPRVAESLLAEADLVIVHNGKVAPEHEKTLEDKAIITMAHNYLWNVDERFFKTGFPGVVVGQYQAILPEFNNWTVAPNPIPLWEAEYQTQTKPEQITICYTPAGKHEKYPPEHRLYWHSKGYKTTMKVLESLSEKFSLKLEVITDRQISHHESLAMKRRSHIVIDECVTGSYHRNSLEGLAGGCVVVNGLGILPKVVDVLQVCAGETADIPFISATLENLEEVLTGLIESGKENLVSKGLENRFWLEKHWDFTQQWNRFWQPAIEKSLRKVNRKALQVNSEKRVLGNFAVKEAEDLKMTQFKEGVSVVIPHGGRNRLPHLWTCLANLRQCGDVNEIIVVEMDKSPTAECIARKWADKYIFLHRADSFERARALNVGSRFAECEFVLWLDGDLLVPRDFVSRAVAELRARKLDFLKPYSEVKYLSFADSENVMSGVINPDECRPANIYYSTTTDGGAGLIRQDFLQRYGGIPAGFYGWGGEDNGWMHKVHLLGKGGRTQSGEHKVFHLYHALSGGYGGNTHIEANPRYQENLALLGKIKNTRHPQDFLKNFPPSPFNIWDASRRICFVVDRDDETANRARKLNDLFAAQVEVISFAEIKESAESWSEQIPDALVFFECQNAVEFFSEDSFSKLADKTLIVADEKRVWTEAGRVTLTKCFGVLATSETIVEELKRTNIKPWIWKRNEREDVDLQSLALALAQPLSLLLNKQTNSITTQTPRVVSRTEISGLPVWLYWEGDCPDWIETCRKTILAHVPQARLLNPESFDELWDADRDINLAHLHVAHRADFIRAFLLNRYGGLWLDSDCVVVKSLKPLLEKMGEHDFAAHRERGGYFGNEFMIAKPGSRIARVFYELICRTLRTRPNFGWCDLGCVSLTDVINKTDADFLEIDCELIQPICWREVEPYVGLGSDSEHRKTFDANAFCYMLSNITVNRYLAANPNKNLLAENSFFSFLARQSLNKIAQNGSLNLTNGNGFVTADSQKDNFAAEHSQQNRQNNRRQEIQFYLENAAKLSPEKVLDLDVGSGLWAVLLRDLFESSDDRKDWQIFIEAIVDSKKDMNDSTSFFYNRAQVGSLNDCLRNIEEKQDLIILGDYFNRHSDAPGKEILEYALNHSDYVLLNFERNNHETNSSVVEISLNEYLELHTEQIAAQSFQEQTNRILLLLTKNDPRKLRPQSAMTRLFDNAAQICRRNGEESVSGPGSSLAQTAEIRRSLPILFASLDINSLLDAPCGDFNWMRSVDLRLEKYFGVDIVSSIIEQNRNVYENQNRKFSVLDVTRDFLPRCDLILCRDFLVHLSFAEIYFALRRFGQSGAKYLLMTTFPNTQVNADIQTGDWRTLNFRLAPFNFPEPLHLLNERCTENNGKYADKSLGLWKISDIEKVCIEKLY